MAVTVFNNRPGVVSGGRVRTSESAYIALTNVAGNALTAALVGTAPVGSVSIVQGVDMDAHKAFDGNYTVASFGQSLTSVVIHGLDIYSRLVGNTCVNRGGVDIQGWWNAYNFAVNPKARILLSVYSRNGVVKFKCVACSLQREIDANKYNASIGTYTLQIAGVNIR